MIVLVAVIVATSKIFNTASKVASTGEATADILQQAGVVEEQLRRDLANATQDGYIAIQCVAVRNDVNRVINNNTSVPLLNPNLDPNAVIRADSIVFFTAGAESSARWSGPNDTSAYGGGMQARASRIYYGHGVQLPDLGNDPTNGGAAQVKPIVLGVSPNPPSGTTQILPWTWYDPATFFVRYQWGTTSNTSSGAPRVTPNQPGAREWVLCRKATLLADDGGRTLYSPDPAAGSLSTAATALGPSASPSVAGDRSYTSPTGADASSMYMELRARNYTPASTNLIPSPMMQSGWVDSSSAELDDIRRLMAPTLPFSSPTYLPPGPPNGVAIWSISPPWVAQNGASAPFALPPIGWPTGTGAPAWPSGTVVGPHFPTGAVASGGFTSQRDRIIRSTFGPVNNNGGVINGAQYSNVGLLGWPRGEKKAPNSSRGSEILLSPVLSNNCSNFQIDWTWERGTGRQTDATGQPLAAADHLGSTTGAVMRGFEPDAGPWNNAALDFQRIPRPQPWFGYPDVGGGVDMLPNQRLGVTLAQDLTAMPNYSQSSGSANTTNLHMRLVAQGIEGVPGNTFVPAVSAPFGANVPVRVYTAIFGFNQDEAYVVTPDGQRVLRDDYTPWPSQLRFTITLHDPRLVLDRGRDFQFVLDLPQRKK
ncbi:MAG: hypothetical protein U0636_01430 [Phycisphaerales bacterium]